MRVMPSYFFGQEFLTFKKNKTKLYDDLKSGLGGWLKREGIYVHIWLIHSVIQQKLTHYKAIIFQEKNMWFSMLSEQKHYTNSGTVSTFCIKAV